MRRVLRSPHIRKVIVGLAFSLSVSVGMAAQQPQELVSCKPMSQKTGETGCWILTSQAFGAVNGPVYWTIDQFQTRELAEQARGAHGTVVESLGKVWLLTVGEPLKPNGTGVRVTQVGPLPVEAGHLYTAQYMEATLLPGMVSKTHLHSGVEAFYTDSGETCLETPSGTQIGKKGIDVVVPTGVPMELTAVGSEPRRGLILILHDAEKPPTTLVSSWKSTGACGSVR